MRVTSDATSTQATRPRGAWLLGTLAVLSRKGSISLTAGGACSFIQSDSFGEMHAAMPRLGLTDIVTSLDEM